MFKFKDSAQTAKQEDGHHAAKGNGDACDDHASFAESSGPMKTATSPESRLRLFEELTFFLAFELGLTTWHDG